MAQNYPDIASPILQAYFEGKKLREQREDRVANLEKEQQRIDQQAQQFKMQMDMKKQEDAERKERDTFDKDFKNRTLEFNKHQLEATVNEAKARAADSNARVAGEWYQRLAQYGVPKGKPFEVPTDAFSEQTAKVALPVKEFSPPGLPDIKIDTTGLDAEGSVARNQRIQDEMRRDINAATLANQKDIAKMNQAAADQRNRDTIEGRRQNAALIAAMKGGPGGQQTEREYIDNAADDVQSLRIKLSDVKKNYQPAVRNAMKFQPPPGLGDKLDRFSNLGPLFEAADELIPMLGEGLVGVQGARAVSKIPGTDIHAKAAAVASKAGNLVRATGIGSADKGNIAAKELERALAGVSNVNQTQEQAKTNMGKLKAAVVKYVGYELRDIPDSNYRQLYLRRALEPLGLYTEPKETAPTQGSSPDISGYQDITGRRK